MIEKIGRNLINMKKEVSKKLKITIQETLTLLTLIELAADDIEKLKVSQEISVDKLTTFIQNLESVKQKLLKLNEPKNNEPKNQATA